jgi:hypothetical protein
MLIWNDLAAVLTAEWLIRRMNPPLQTKKGATHIAPFFICNSLKIN